MIDWTAIIDIIFLVSVLFVTFETVISRPSLISDKFLELFFIRIDELFGHWAVNQEILYISFGQFNFTVNSTLITRIYLIKAVLRANHREYI